MATWLQNHAVITKKGHELINKAKVGEGKITISSVVAGAGRVNFDDLEEQIAVSDIKQTLDITGITFVEDGSILSLQLSNEHLEESYQLNQIGVYVTHPSEQGSVLYFIAQCEIATGDADVIPLYSDTPAILNYNFILLESNSAVIQYTPDMSGSVTRTEFNKHVQDYNNPHRTSFEQLIDFEKWRDIILSKADQTELDKVNGRIDELEEKIYTDIEDNPFTLTYETLDGLVVTGIWNKVSQRLEC